MTHFDVETDCNEDVVHIHDGNSTDDRKIGEDGYCGTLLPFALHSSNNTLLLHFVSDRSGHGRGFTFSVAFIGKCVVTQVARLCTVHICNEIMSAGRLAMYKITAYADIVLGHIRRHTQNNCQ